MAEIVEVWDVKTLPEKDLYRSQSATSTVFWINPDQRVCGACQSQTGNGIPYDQYVGNIFTYNIDQEGDERVDSDELERYLKSEACQNLLERVCDGWYTDWDGHNMRGYLDEDADKAIDAILDGILELSSEEWTLDSSEVFAYPFKKEINGLTTDEELAEMASSCEGFAKDEHIVIGDSVLDRLTEWRDEALAEWLEYAADSLDEDVEDAIVSHRTIDGQTLEVEYIFPDGRRGIVHVIDGDAEVILQPDTLEE